MVTAWMGCEKLVKKLATLANMGEEGANIWIIFR